MTAEQPDVTISIVNTNNRKLLEPCLESIYATNTGRYRFEVTVVDNVSTDGSVEMIRDRFPEVSVIRNERREGFGANHNKVLRIGKGRYFLVLNEDTVMLNDAIEKMVAFADEHPESGMVGPKTYNPDGTLQDTCVHFPTIGSQLKHVFFQRFSQYSVIAYPPEIHDTVADVEWLRGSCMLVRREAMDQVGMLDERFFIFYEEVDWCYRMRKGGWRNLLCPEAHMIHVGKQTVSQPSTNLAMAAQMHLSELLYFDKHYPQFGGPFWRCFLVGYLVLRLAKTRVIGYGSTAAEREFYMRLLRHLLSLTLSSPSRLREIGQFPGGIVPTGAA